MVVAVDGRSGRGIILVRVLPRPLSVARVLSSRPQVTAVPVLQDRRASLHPDRRVVGVRHSRPGRRARGGVENTLPRAPATFIKSGGTLFGDSLEPGRYDARCVHLSCPGGDSA